MRQFHKIIPALDAEESGIYDVMAADGLYSGISGTAKEFERAAKKINKFLEKLAIQRATKKEKKR